MLSLFGRRLAAEKLSLAGSRKLITSMEPDIPLAQPAAATAAGLLGCAAKPGELSHLLLEGSAPMRADS